VSEGINLLDVEYTDKPFRFTNTSEIHLMSVCIFVSRCNVSWHGRLIVVTSLNKLFNV